MDEKAYHYRINSIKLKDGEPFSPGKINVFVGANNCGKTQLLKDMLAYITGKKGEHIILDKLEIPYPNSWEVMEQTYKMHPVETANGLQIRHICPTLDKEPSGPIHHDLRNVMESWLKGDSTQFRVASGPGLVTYLNTDNRLKLAMGQQVQKDLQNRGAKNVLEALYLAGTKSTQNVRACVNNIFDTTDVYLDSSNLGMIQFRVGADFSSIPDNPQDAFEKLKDFVVLDDQGDGLRSVLGMITAIIALEKPIILLDEPEAFLHPPQALQLGEIISKIASDDQQVFIATHSADFLRGLLGATRDSVIVHLDRTANDTKANVLDAETLNQIVTDPLLSSSRVLDGMFYKGVVATEADADAVFYQRLFQKIGAADEIHFVNAHNKQTLKKIIIPYKKLGVKFAMIADADVIRDKHDLDEILDVTADVDIKERIHQEREVVLNHFQNKSKYETLCELRDNTKKLVEETTFSSETSPDDLSHILFDFRLALKKLREDSDDLAEFKKSGRAALPTEIQANFDTLWNACASIGLFVVKVGELESWLGDYGVARTSNKSKWISEALGKLFEIEYDGNREIWKFVNALKNYLST